MWGNEPVGPPPDDRFSHSSMNIRSSFTKRTALRSPNTAVDHGSFGGDFSYLRMSWIKPSFLWMMYRSRWGLKEDRESIIALRLRREFFDRLLSEAVPSSRD